MKRESNELYGLIVIYSTIYISSKHVKKKYFIRRLKIK